ncbi:MAG: DUF167 domain-containing protein [Candidatus Roizmanbacteria bacterium]|nr:DUF167 domain-containing protein [Candidatus Roizmanbacteria bacterium]
MKIFVKVKPKAREEKIIKIDSTHYLVHIKEAPEKGKANKAVIERMSEYYNIPKSHFKIISGLTSKQKSIEITTT